MRRDGSKEWMNHQKSAFVGELRLIADRWKKGEIKDWGRLRTIIGNLVHGNYESYLFDMNRRSVKEVEDDMYKRYSDNLMKHISDRDNKIAELEFEIKKMKLEQDND